MRIKYWVKDKCLNFKWRCQRFKRGYADVDVWGMNAWFVNTVGPMLRQLADVHSYPIECSGPEEWEEILMDMYWSLWHMDEDNVAAELKPEFQNDYQLIYKIMNENKDHFFELFSKWFYNLWD